MILDSKAWTYTTGGQCDDGKVSLGDQNSPGNGAPCRESLSPEGYYTQVLKGNQLSMDPKTPVERSVSYHLILDGSIQSELTRCGWSNIGPFIMKSPHKSAHNTGEYVRNEDELSK